MTQLVAGSAVLALGVALLLDARLGSDGFSTFISGLSLSTATDFAIINGIVSALLIGAAWAKGLRPGLATLVQPVVVGLAVSALLAALPTPEALGWRVAELVLGLLVISVGVAAYLTADLGSGPAEALSLAFDPPVRFTVSYTAFQVVCLLLGWWLGASVGLGTVLVALLIGPLVERISPHLAPGTGTGTGTGSTEEVAQP